MDYNILRVLNLQTYIQHELHKPATINYLKQDNLHLRSLLQ